MLIWLEKENQRRDGAVGGAWMGREERKLDAESRGQGKDERRRVRMWTSSDRTGGRSTRIGKGISVPCILFQSSPGGNREIVRAKKQPGDPCSARWRRRGGRGRGVSNKS
mmetsp:Transcript_34641/g.78165  ORF Transcript_34641/g.78165 Transcript_34641/m.78165 type:complete len:110 (-) Transcript_34641:340-669(-)|eukprot:749350-Hanusia_phi.AAC.1